MGTVNSQSGTWYVCNMMIKSSWHGRISQKRKKYIAEHRSSAKKMALLNWGTHVWGISPSLSAAPWFSTWTCIHLRWWCMWPPSGVQWKSGFDWAIQKTLFSVTYEHPWRAISVGGLKWPKYQFLVLPTWNLIQSARLWYIFYIRLSRTYVFTVYNPLAPPSLDSHRFGLPRVVIQPTLPYAPQSLKGHPCKLMEFGLVWTLIVLYVGYLWHLSCLNNILVPQPDPHTSLSTPRVSLTQ